MNHACERQYGSSLKSTWNGELLELPSILSLALRSRQAAKLSMSSLNLQAPNDLILTFFSHALSLGGKIGLPY
jgi:hypothetical protein